MKRRYLIGNWKLYLDVRRSASVAAALARRVRPSSSSTLVICPSAPSLGVVRAALKKSRIILGAQNAGRASDGAATGEDSPRDLYELGCRYVLVGHSERRARGESDVVVAAKLRSIAKAKMVPVLCVGESAFVRRSGRHHVFVSAQLRTALKGFRGTCIVAYEPVWSISKAGATPKICTPEEAEKMRVVVLRTLRSLHVRPRAILYGGSVNAKTIASYCATGFDGALVGFASTKAPEYATMAAAIA